MPNSTHISIVLTLFKFIKMFCKRLKNKKNKEEKGSPEIIFSYIVSFTHLQHFLYISSLILVDSRALVNNYFQHFVTFPH